jgi:hypothetical protein
VVAVAWGGTSAVSVTDTRGNVYAVATSAYDAVNGQTLAILHAANAISGATTVTASFGGTPAAQRLEIHEYSGIATTSPVDVAATNVTDGVTTADTITSGSATTTGHRSCQTVHIPDGAGPRRRGQHHDVGGRHGDGEQRRRHDAPGNRGRHSQLDHVFRRDDQLDDERSE